MSLLLASGGSLLSTVGLTELVELPLAAALGVRRSRALLWVALVNLITNPVLNIGLALCWAAVPQMSVAGILSVLVVGEVVVVAAEWLMLRPVLRPSSLTPLAVVPVVVALNCASAAVGLWVLWA